MPLELLASGRDADVFVLDESTVLRRCRRPDAHCEDEAALQSWAAAQGFPAPRVLSAAGADMVLERVDGPMLLDAVVAGDLGIGDCAGILADLHRRLDELPLPPDAATRSGASAPRGRSPSDGGQTGVRHLDLHPLNVLMTARGPVLIDWTNADVGDRGVDVALSSLILAQVAVLPGPLSEPAAALLEAFRPAGGPTSRDRAAMAAAVAFRRLDPNMSGDELSILDDAADLALGIS